MIVTMLMIFLIDPGMGMNVLTSHRITPIIANVMMIAMSDIDFLSLLVSSVGINLPHEKPNNSNSYNECANWHIIPIGG
jgi:hypothetical protein